jgi:2-polyprenyl-6-methoxyphenol hydroxylase-like FAD-dependent oxidoreductase
MGDPDVIVLGGGLCGLAAALLLARDGHAVTVLERDDAAVPESPEVAWEGWRRGGVAQFRQAHYMTPRGREVLETSLPDVAAALEAAGALRFDTLGLMPPTIADRAPRPGDERFVTLTARRPVIEMVVGRAAEAEPGVDVRRGVEVTGLEVRELDGLPHVGGVRTADGAVLPAALVVDATGRRSCTPGWLEDAGAAAPEEEAEDSGFLYYTRFFAPGAAGSPAPRGPLNTPFGTFAILTLPADRGTWSVTLYAAAGDRPLKALRDPARFSAVVAACPLHGHWIDGEPLTGVVPMGGVVDRRRRMVRDGRPVATGIALLADAWACTNPSLGRGMTLGLLHAAALPGLLREHADDPLAFATAWDASTEAELTPWYRETVVEDRARLREWDANRRGEAPPSPDAPPAQALAALLRALPWDADAFRAFLASRGCLAPLGGSLADPAFMARVREVAAAHERRPVPGPSRAKLLELLA